MICARKELLAIIPKWMIPDVNIQIMKGISEIRLRIHGKPEIVFAGKSTWINGSVSREDIDYCINTASKYSPWAAGTISSGYITVEGGHRIGICGDAVYKNGIVSGIRNISSLCIRVACDFPNISGNLCDQSGSILILGAPGWGKTTLLRDLARRIAMHETVSVVDERGELFPMGISRGDKMDIFSGITKVDGIEMVLRTMGPECIAVDEITAKEDCKALISAYGCGVRLLATAHAGSFKEFRSREIYKELIDSQMFNTVVFLRPDKSYQAERIVP